MPKKLTLTQRMNALEGRVATLEAPKAAPTPTPTPDPVGSPEAEEAQRRENEKQTAYQAPVPATWQEGQMVQRKGVASREPQPITFINYGAGTVFANSWDDSDGWKNIGPPWQQWHNVTLDGTQS